MSQSGVVVGLGDSLININETLVLDEVFESPFPWQSGIVVLSKILTNYQWVWGEYLKTSDSCFFNQDVLWKSFMNKGEKCCHQNGL